MSQQQHHQPIPPYPPPRRGLNLGWLIGGVSGSLAVILAVVATLVGTGVFGSQTRAPGSDDAGEKKHVVDTYAYVDDLCGKLDVSALVKIAPLDGRIESEEDENTGRESYAVCYARFLNDDKTVGGSLNASASRFKTEAAAAKDAEATREGGDGNQVISDLSGNWDFGNIATTFFPSTGSTKIYVLIQDDNFTAIADATFTRSEGLVDEAELQQAAVDTAVAILDQHRK